MRYSGSVLPPSEVFVSAHSVLIEYAPAVVDAARAGIQDVAELMATPLNVRNVGSEWGTGDYESVDWFLEGSRISDPSGVHDGKILFEVIHKKLTDDPYRRIAPHLGYMLLARDMTVLGQGNRPLNFVFGVTDKSIGQSVQSVARFMQAGVSRDQMNKVTRHVARHEFGHLIGLDDSTIKNQDTRGGLYTGHCTRECTMQQIMSVPEALLHAQRLEDKSHAGFCADCADYVRTF